MKKSLLILSALIFASGQILSKGFTVTNNSLEKIFVKADGQLDDSKQKFDIKGTKSVNNYIPIESKKKQYIETGSGERGASWMYGDNKTVYYTYLKYSSPETLTINNKDQKYIMNQSIGYKKDEQLPLTKEEKEKKQTEEKAAEQAKKDKVEYDNEIKKINAYKKTDELFRYIDEKKQVLKNTAKDKKDTVKKLDSYAVAALDQIVKKYSEQINKKIKETEFDINTFKVELNTIQNKINDRINIIKETPLNLANIHQKESNAYKTGKSYSIEEKSGSKSYASILDAINTRRGALGVAKESTPFKALTDDQIKKEKDFYKLRDTHLKKTEQEIARLKLKESAESYNTSTGYKTKTDKNFEALEASIKPLNEKIDELKKAYKEKQSEIAAEEKKAKEEKDAKDKEAREIKTKEAIEAKENEIKEKNDTLKEKETETKNKEKTVKDKEKELDLENKKLNEQEEKDAQEIKNMEIKEKAQIDNDLEKEKINNNAKYTSKTSEQEKKDDLDKLEKYKQEKLNELTANISLKKADQKKSLVDLKIEVEANIKKQTQELNDLKKELDPLNKELVTIKNDIDKLKKDLTALKK